MFHCLWLHFNHHLVSRHCICLPVPLVLPSTCSPLGYQKKSHAQAQVFLALKALHPLFGAKAIFYLSTPSFLWLFPDLGLCLPLHTVTRDTQEPISGRTEKAPKKERCQVAMQPFSSLPETEISNLFCRLYHLPGDRKALAVPEEQCY